MNKTLAFQNASRLADTITDDQIRQSANTAMTDRQIAAVRNGISAAISALPDCDIDTFATDPRPLPRQLIMSQLLDTSVRSVLQS